MTLPGLLLTALALAAIAVVVLILAAVVRHAPRARSADALARGDFGAAVAAAANGASGAELVPASIAARHLGNLETAAGLATKAVRADPDDGEAWLELGLVRGYAGELAAASTAFDRALADRSDLAEAVTLHRAWLALRAGDPPAARHLFDEVEAPLETKLRLDLGSGEPAFADWFFQAGELWLAVGRSADEVEMGHWALAEARRSAPGSRLFGNGDQSPGL